MTESVRSLTELIEKASARRFLDAPAPSDMGLAEPLTFPFLSIVGQKEMKLALMLAVINMNIGGVLLVGPRGTGKTTAARSLTGLLPDVARSKCNYGCMPEDIISGGMDAVCPDCAQRFAENDPLTFMDKVRLIELPLNSRLEDVIGGLDERAALHQRLRLNRGLLARADKNLLYVDEVNLLEDDIIDAILDAAAQGIYTVHRGPLAATYRARFVLIGSMNPEEGHLRPQILDRFGLRVLVRGLERKEDRLEAYRRSITFRSNPHQVIEAYANSTDHVREELSVAREKLPDVKLSSQAEKLGLKLIEELGIDSLRSEITLFESARAYAVADGRLRASTDDVRKVAPLALRLRRSAFMRDYISSRAEEEEEIELLINDLKKKSTTRKSTRKKK
jgi:magnesium chelatase subunit I